MGVKPRQNLRVFLLKTLLRRTSKSLVKCGVSGVLAKNWLPNYFAKDSLKIEKFKTFELSFVRGLKILVSAVRFRPSPHLK
jgi:hypothetical protein